MRALRSLLPTTELPTPMTESMPAVPASAAERATYAASVVAATRQGGHFARRHIAARVPLPLSSGRPARASGARRVATAQQYPVVLGWSTARTARPSHLFAGERHF